MSGPNLPLQPPLPSLPSPEPALQKATLHPLNNQARSPPRRFLSCGLFFSPSPGSVKLLLMVLVPQPKGPLTSPPHPTRDSPSSRFHRLISAGPLKASTQAASLRSSGKTVVCLPEAYQAESTPSMAGAVMMSGWAGSPAVGTGSPCPLDPPAQEGTVTGPCRKGP